MVLHIFTKRNKSGKHISPAPQWKESFNEAPQILKKDMDEGFQFTIYGIDGDIWEVGLNTKIQGFELKNDKGLVIDRYVTPIE